MRDFRDLDTRLRAQAFLDELNALMDKHGFFISCSGYECEGLELEATTMRSDYALPTTIHTSFPCQSVTLVAME